MLCLSAMSNLLAARQRGVRVADCLDRFSLSLVTVVLNYAISFAPRRGVQPKLINSFETAFTHQIQHLAGPQYGPLRTSVIGNIAMSPDNKLWISQESGVFMYDLHGKHIESPLLRSAVEHREPLRNATVLFFNREVFILFPQSHAGGKANGCAALLWQNRISILSVTKQRTPNQKSLIESKVPLSTATASCSFLGWKKAQHCSQRMASSCAGGSHTTKAIGFCFGLTFATIFCTLKRGGSCKPGICVFRD